MNYHVSSKFRKLTLVLCGPRESLRWASNPNSIVDNDKYSVLNSQSYVRPLELLTVKKVVLYSSVGTPVRTFPCQDRMHGCRSVAAVAVAVAVALAEIGESMREAT